MSPRAPRLPEALPLLGHVPDRELARRIGVSNSTIHYHRIKSGIPCAVSGKLADYRDRLGTCTDAQLAKDAGTSRQAVSKLRNHLGIPAWGGR